MAVSTSGTLAGITTARRGQALVEFAVVAFVTMLLVTGTLTLGLAIYSANVLQQAADVGAMELARFPNSPTATFDAALYASGLFEEKYLVCSIGGPHPSEEDLPTAYTPADLTALRARMPLINRLLFSLYVFDPDTAQIRYPGALAMNGDGDETVLIPIIGPGDRDPTTGIETISEWRHVVEEVTSNGVGPYSLTAVDASNPYFMSGTVALRINFPFQSAAMVAYQYKDSSSAIVYPSAALGTADLTNHPVMADDAAVVESAMLPSGYTLIHPAPNLAFGASAHRGEFGLGELQAHATTVRPYRKVLTAQAIYRREVFE